MSSSKNETRTRILAAAWELLESQRGKNVRMSDIAKRADVSRQAVYLHFKTRSELMIATVQYGDVRLDQASQIMPWREAIGGLAKLDAWIEVYGNYIPQIYGVAKALLLVRESDESAEAAWQDRMADMRSGCSNTIEALEEDGMLSAEFTQKTATDLLWTILSIFNWELLTQDCGWSQEQYIAHMQTTARKLLVAL